MGSEIKEIIKLFIKKCPLASLVMMSVVLMTLYALIGIIKGDYKFKLSLDHPILASVFESDDGIDYDEIPEVAPVVENTPTDAVVASGTDSTPYVEPQYKIVEMRKARYDSYDDDNRIALTTDYDYVKVDESYFKDALFIGDSRVVGLDEYGCIEDTDYLCKEGAAIHQINEMTFKDGRTLDMALSQNKYKKIYIMIGVNELGYGGSKEYAALYGGLVEKIRGQQPDAIIFIMGMMYVTTEYSNSHDAINNDNIDNRNANVAALANGIDVFYLDMNTAVVDETGGLNSEYTYDGIHLLAEHYGKWVDFLLEHGVE